MITRTLLIALLAALAPALHAQEADTAPPIQPSRFLPANYDTLAFADFAKIRNIELWDGLRTSVAGALFAAFESEYGFGMGDLDQLYMAPSPPNNRGMRINSIQVMVGNSDVTFPVNLDQETAESVAIGGFDGFLRHGDLLFSPAAGAFVQGDRAMLEPILANESHSGVPSPDLLVATTDPGNLAYVVISPSAAELGENPVFKALLPADGDRDWLAEDDRFQSMTFRIAFDRETEHVSVHVEGRFAAAKANADAFEQHLASWFASFGKTQQALPFRSLLKKIEFHRDGALVGARVDLGPPRQASAHLATILPMLMMSGSGELQPVREAQPRKKR